MENTRIKQIKYISLAMGMAILLSLQLVIPVRAVKEYGAIYDETEILWSEELERLGTQVLPELTEKYDIDMRVDVITTLGEFEDVAQAAEDIYQKFGYGGVHGGNGVTLTILVHEDETGVALDTWHPYAAGESWELVDRATWNMNVGEMLSEEAWAGDLEEDIEVFTQVVTNMAEGIEHFVLAGGVHATIWNPESGFVWEQTMETVEETVEEIVEALPEAVEETMTRGNEEESVENTETESSSEPTLELSQEIPIKTEQDIPDESAENSVVVTVSVLLIGLVVGGALILVICMKKK